MKKLFIVAQCALFSLALSVSLRAQTKIQDSQLQGSYSGTGSCGSQFVVGLNRNSVPTCGTPSGSNGSANPTVSFTNQTSVTLTMPATSPYPIPLCWDASSSPNQVFPSNVGYNTSTGVLTFSFATPQSGTCTANQWGGAAGGVGSGTQFGGTYWATGTTLGTVVPPTVPGIYQFGYNVTSSGVAVAPTATLVGLLPRSVGGTTSSDTILYSDNSSTVDYQGSVSVAVTLHSATVLANPNFFTILDNFTTGASTTVTLTPAADTPTWTINGISSPFSIQKGQSCTLTVDASNATNWLIQCSAANTPAIGGDCLTAFNATAGTFTQASCGGGSPALSSVTGSTAAATGTETAAGNNYTFAGVETGSLTAPFVITNSNSTNNNSSSALIIGTTGTSTGAVPLVINEATAAGDLIDAYTGGTVTNGVLSGGTNQFSVSKTGGITGAYVSIGTGAFTGDSLRSNVASAVLNINVANGSTNSAIATLTLSGGSQTGAGGANSQGGPVLITGGGNTATNTGSQAGSVMIAAGSSTGATQGTQGLVTTTLSYAYAGTGSTQWHLECPNGTTAKSAVDCGASPVNWLGAAETVGTNTIMVATSGETFVTASAAVTNGDTVCAGTTAGEVTDSGGTGACTTGVLVGVVEDTAGKYKLGDGTVVTATTTLPLILIRH